MFGIHYIVSFGNMPIAIFWIVLLVLKEETQARFFKAHKIWASYILIGVFIFLAVLNLGLQVFMCISNRSEDYFAIPFHMGGLFFGIVATSTKSAYLSCLLQESQLSINGNY